MLVNQYWFIGKPTFTTLCLKELVNVGFAWKNLETPMLANKICSIVGNIGLPTFTTLYLWKLVNVG